MAYSTDCSCAEWFCLLICAVYLFVVPDTAAVYRNEEAIGLALQNLLPKLSLSREDLFLTTKLGILSFLLCFVDCASLYNLINKTN
jgi:hypothetical protein